LRRGLSLFEVILALAVLTMSLAVLGELARLGMRNARIARDKTQAILLCQSKMAEIVSGVIVPEPVQALPLEDLGESSEPGWLYSIAVEPGDQEGLIMVQVTVAQDLPLEKRPVEFSLTRWMLDPNVGFSDQASGVQGQTKSSSSESQSSG